MGIEIFNKHLREKRAIKATFKDEKANTDSIIKFCRTAQSSRASAVDIPCNKQFIDVARKNTKLPLFVSSLHPFEILNAVRWGIDGIEIGNFDSAYKKNQSYSAVEIYDIVLETMALINDYEVFICVSIPGCLEYGEQLDLAKKLQILGVDLIQLEGISKINEFFVKDENKAIENVNKMIEQVYVPFSVIVESDNTSSQAFVNGASGISVDCTSIESEAVLKTHIMKIVSSISYRNSIYFEIPRTVNELMKSF